MDIEELNKAMITLGAPPEQRTPAMLQEMIDKYDLNGDGTLSYKEFLVMMNLAPEKPKADPAPAAPAPAKDPAPAAKGGDTPAPAAKPTPADDAGNKAKDCSKLKEAADVCKAN